MNISKMGHLIRQQRQMLGITQSQLAEITKIGTAQFLCNIEKGRADVPVSKILKVCRALFLDREYVRKIYLSDQDQMICKTLNIKQPKLKWSKPKGRPMKGQKR
jgi:transcriptional regulator with XRE-family HTH domain